MDIGYDNAFLTPPREEIESKRRFSTALLGFDRKSVKNYIHDLVKTFDQTYSDLKSERDALSGDKKILSARLMVLGNELTEAKVKLSESSQAVTRLEAELEQNRLEVQALREKISSCDETRHELAGKNEALSRLRHENGQLSANLSLLDKVVQESKAANARLTDENARRGLRIAQLEEKAAADATEMKNALSLLSTLGGGTAELLLGKLAECEHLIAAWQTEYSGTIGETRESLGKDIDV